jgi:hypothetical protein
MERLGIASWLARHPDAAPWPIPVAILRAVAARLRTLGDDPLMEALEVPPERLPPHVRAAVRHWVHRLRAHLRRTARLGFRELVCRDGRVAFTETHIDVSFELDRADIRVRRAGLDVDPGWTPWLGRVIRFHYVARGAHDA